ncbi:hypothetical protein P3L10_012210 [Capsicum annuum]
MWSLRSAIDDSYDSFLVFSFIDVTRFYQIVLDETSREGFTSLSLAEASIEGFNSDVQTLFCHQAVYDQLVLNDCLRCFLLVLVLVCYADAITNSLEDLSHLSVVFDFLARGKTPKLSPSVTLVTSLCRLLQTL